ncbi:MAG TPA: SMC-Scp complex subunit ScpB [Actinocrinis sp.]|nr:SMC-Scp complex subunit ScpB [Actinocrinis sp.]
MSEIPSTGGSAFWAARGVRIEPEPVLEPEDEVVALEPGPEPEEPTAAAIPVARPDADQPDSEPSAEAPAEHEPSASAAEAEPAQEAVSEPEVAPEPEADAPAELLETVDAAVPDPEPDSPEAPAATASSLVPFIPTQATFDEVEPQPGKPVDGLVALNETLIDAARAKAEREAKAAEPAWQLTDDALAALPDLRTLLEAILLVVDEPVTEVMLAQIVERPTEQVAAALRALSAEYNNQGRGFDLREVGIGDGSLVTQTGWRFYTRAECAPVVERYIRDGQQSKLTQAALETLAVVAYRQPVSRSKVSAIRGVNCDGVMRTLLARGLVEECGTEYETGALLYRTTGYFLERMGLKGLEELPDLAPLLPSAADMEDEV